MIKINTKNLVLAGVLALVSMSSYAQMVNAKTFGKGFTFTTADTSASMKLHVRMQNLMEVGVNDFLNEANDDSSFDDPDVKFLTRRYRLKFGGFVLDKRLRYKMELGISNRDQGNTKNQAFNSSSANIVLDAVVKYKLTKNLDFWFGQTKLPGNRERVVSSANLQFVDRSKVNSEYNIDRDAGVQLRGQYGEGIIIRPQIAISTGEGRNITSISAGGLSYTGRLEVLPFGKFEGKKADYVLSDLDRQSKPKVAFGATYNLNDGAARQGGQLGYFVKDYNKSIAKGKDVLVENTLQAVFVDALFKYRGVSFLGEYANKWAADDYTETVFDDAGNYLSGDLDRLYTTGWGVNTQLGYLFKSNWEIAGRYTYVEPDKAESSSVKERTEYTMCVSKYLVGHNLKIQSDLGFFHGAKGASNDGNLLYRLQIEVQL